MRTSHALALPESSDAYHMSAPEPAGKGAEIAIRAALADAGLEPGQIGYINLHGTATIKNDKMESCPRSALLAMMRIGKGVSSCPILLRSAVAMSA